MLPEEARTVIGEWCGECACEACAVAVPPASWTTTLLRAVDAKSVLSTYSRVLQCLWHITMSLQHQENPKLLFFA